MRRVIVGAVAGSFGVRGWLKVHSYTDPPENILHYRPWWIESGGVGRSWSVVSGHSQGKAMVVAALDGVETPEDAQKMKGMMVSVDRDLFPPTAPGEFYRIDLMGLAVKDRDGQSLGRVSDVLTTGANDVLVVSGERERLIPFVQPDVVLEVDLEAQTITVDWDASF